MKKKSAAKQFKQMCDDYAISIAYVAEKTGISRQHLCNWVSGKYRLSAKNALKIEAFTMGKIKMLDCILPDYEDMKIYIPGVGKTAIKDRIHNPSILGF